MKKEKQKGSEEYKVQKIDINLLKEEQMCKLKQEYLICPFAIRRPFHICRKLAHNENKSRQNKID